MWSTTLAQRIILLIEIGTIKDYSFHILGSFFFFSSRGLWPFIFSLYFNPDHYHSFLCLCSLTFAPELGYSILVVCTGPQISYYLVCVCGHCLLGVYKVEATHSNLFLPEHKYQRTYHKSPTGSSIILNNIIISFRNLSLSIQRGYTYRTKLVPLQFPSQPSPSYLILRHIMESRMGSKPLYNNQKNILEISKLKRTMILPTWIMLHGYLSGTFHLPRLKASLRSSVNTARGYSKALDR